jgi:hypothetical protein
VQRVTGIEVLDQEHAEHADEMRPARQAYHVDGVIEEVDAGVGRQPRWAIPGAGLVGVR